MREKGVSTPGRSRLHIESSRDGVSVASPSQYAKGPTGKPPLSPGPLAGPYGPSPRRPARQLPFSQRAEPGPSSRASPAVPASPVSPLRKGPMSPAAQHQLTPRKGCNCKNSRCLKLYCECFSSGRYCLPSCNCVSCYNNRENETRRQMAVEAILDRNPNAFRPKIAATPDGQEAAKHNKGCNCRKSNCLKKYCECFQAGIACSDNCKCADCKNFEGSEALAAIRAQEAAAAAPLTPPPAKKIRGGLSPADSGPESPFAPSPLSSFPGHGGGAVAEEAEPQIKRVNSKVKSAVLDAIHAAGGLQGMSDKLISVAMSTLASIRATAPGSDPQGAGAGAEEPDPLLVCDEDVEELPPAGAGGGGEREEGREQQQVEVDPETEAVEGAVLSALRVVIREVVQAALAGRGVARVQDGEDGAGLWCSESTGGGLEDDGWAGEVQGPMSGRRQ